MKGFLEWKKEKIKQKTQIFEKKTYLCKLFRRTMYFKDIVGQRELINSLTRIIDSGRISHAQLFLGKNGYGSLALALAYAQYLNCENRVHYPDVDEQTQLRADSCGKCPSCIKYQQLVHSDLHFVFPNTAVKSTDKDVSSKDLMQEFRTYMLENNSYIRLEDFFEYLGVEKKQGAINVRDAAEINRILGLKTYEAKYKVMVIWMIEKLNTAAAPKLLKILEEPTDNTIFLLVSENQDKILSTIRSRMQNVQLRKIDEQSMRQYLQNILPDSNVENILQAAEGDIIEARNIISKTEQDQLFAELFVTWTRQLFKLQMLSLSAWVDKMHAMGREQQKQFLLYALDSFRACFLKTVAGVNLSYQLDFGDEKFNNAFPRMISERNIEGIENVINKTIYAIERNAFSKIAFMDLSFSISKLLKQ
mgnify:CR=1 FL=1